MATHGWNSKRERQYEHIKDDQLDRGASPGEAKEIAARVVNKNRAQAGESEQASSTPVQDLSPQRRGGQRCGNSQRPRGRTKAQLYNEAQEHGITGRSRMSKAQLEHALEHKK